MGDCQRGATVKTTSMRMGPAFAVAVLMVFLSGLAGASSSDVLLLFGGGRVQGGPGAFSLQAALLGLRAGNDVCAPQEGAATVRMRVQVDAEGVANGTGPDDLLVTGSMDLDGDGSAEHEGVLLTGALEGFGFENGAAGTDRYDLQFRTTGGSLAAVLGPRVGVAVTSKDSTFTGQFTAAFTGTAEGTVGAIAGTALPAVPDTSAQGQTGEGGDDAGGNLPAPAGAPEDDALAILTDTGVAGGFIGHLGCGDGQLTAALHLSDAYHVHGLDTDPADVAAARLHIRAEGLYGKVAVARYGGTTLPYVENLLTLLVVEDAGGVSTDEMLRVVAPGGVLYVKDGDSWIKTVKPRPDAMDDWPHYLYDSTNNAVSHDQLVGPPRHLQWIGGPWWSRHHDRMASCSAMVAAGGRMFYIMDEGPRSSVELTPCWRLTGRDAFNGQILWKRDIKLWHSALWPFKSGPAPLPRRLVTDEGGLRVYATLGLDDPVTALDAFTGRTVRTYPETLATEELVLSDGVLFCQVREPHTFRPAYIPVYKNVGSSKDRVRSEWMWDGAPRDIVAIEAATGDVLWTKADVSVCPLSLTVDADNVYYHDGERIVCLDRTTSAQTWASSPLALMSGGVPTCFGPTLVSHGDYVLFAGGDGKMHGLRKSDGQLLWTETHHTGGHNSPRDLLVVPADVDGSPRDLAWSGQIAGTSNSGIFTGRNLETGAGDVEFLPDLGFSTYWFHHRCYRSKATDRYIMISRTGLEFIDPDLSEGPRHWEIHHWTRGGCLYGVMPCNGMIYSAPDDCACYLLAKMYGFNALASASASRPKPGEVPDAGRLEAGPAYERTITGPEDPAVDWPTYRHDAVRSGATTGAVPSSVRRRWESRVGGRLSSLTAADGRLYVCAIDAHRVVALDAERGQVLWSYTAGGRVDSPPTVYNGRVLFGSADGYVYCVEAETGELAWRFRAAPIDQRLGAFGQVESTWPVHGSVLVHDDGTNGPLVYCVAGRSMFLDGGMRWIRLDPVTGQKLGETDVILDDRDPMDPANPDRHLQNYVNILNMPTALPDVLSSDGTQIYMREQVFDPDGTRPVVAVGSSATHAKDQSGPYPHLFSPTGFLDGAWFHRSYWVWGQAWSGGHHGYYLAGKFAPGGRILAIGDDTVYGYGRKPEYYKWTTPIEYQLFAADRASPASNAYVDVANSTTLNPAGTALTVEAWVKPNETDGVVVAHGGASHGYALFLEGGTPHFAVRVSNTKYEAAAAGAIPTGTWTHLAGVLTADAKVKVFVNGAPAGAADAGFIASEPSNIMQVAQDRDSAVGSYEAPFGINGAIDELCVYRRELAEAEIASHHATPGAIDTGDAALVLYFSFDAGNAADDSGHGNNGTVIGAQAVAGKAGTALAFGNVDGGSITSVVYQWSLDVPLHVRGMVKAGDTLFVAGPRDMIDEETAFDSYTNRLTQARFRRQTLALSGWQGGLLRAVSTADGSTLMECRLPVVPVFDGMISANGKLYMATTDGRIMCLGGR